MPSELASVALAWYGCPTPSNEHHAGTLKLRSFQLAKLPSVDGVGHVYSKRQCHTEAESVSVATLSTGSTSNNNWPEAVYGTCLCSPSVQSQLPISELVAPGTAPCLALPALAPLGTALRPGTPTSAHLEPAFCPGLPILARLGTALPTFPHLGTLCPALAILGLALGQLLEGQGSLSHALRPVFQMAEDSRTSK